MLLAVQRGAYCTGQLHKDGELSAVGGDHHRQETLQQSCSPLTCLPMAEGYFVRYETAAFPLKHTCIDPDGTDPTKHWICVNRLHFVQFLDAVPRLQRCPIHVLRTAPNPALKPISDYITIAKDVSTQSGTRTYKYCEGLANVLLTVRGLAVDLDTVILSVSRTCKPGCAAMAWIERVTGQNIRDNMVQVKFSSYGCMDHRMDCVPTGATERPKPLIGQYLAVKAMSRATQVRATDIEQGLVTIDLSDTSTLPTDLLTLSGGLPLNKIKKTMDNARRVGREGAGDFETMDRIIMEQLQRSLTDGGDIERGTVMQIEQNSMRVIDYHPCQDPSSDDVKNPASHYWCLIELPGAQRDMAAHGNINLAYDAKVKFIIEGMLVMPFCTATPARPAMPGLGTPAPGLLLQHVTEPNYILLANTEAAEVITAAANAIRGNLCCNRAGCVHKQVVTVHPVAGYTVGRPECAQHTQPGLWQRELIDACAAYLKSIYARAFGDSDDWTELRAIICRFHDVRHSHLSYLRHHF